jgi:ethanolamine utilization protein EutN
VKVCLVLGPVVSTIKHPAYNGEKLLSVQPVDGKGEPLGAPYLAVDRAQAGEGELVLVLTEGNGARQIFGADILPIRSVIVGTVDAYDFSGEAT